MVGIITLSNSTLYNYGGILQNYALTVFVNKKKDARAIHCDAMSFQGLLKVLLLHKCGIFLKDKKSIVFLNKNQRKRGKNFQDFIKKEIHPDIYAFYRKKVYKTINEKYDFFIVGSDQVWNPYMAMSGKGPYKYFLSFADESKRIAYAASFGLNSIPDSFIPLYTNNLKRFAHISVREKDGASIVFSLIGRQVPIVLDPVFLLKRNEWEEVANKAVLAQKKNYILKYFLGDLNQIYNDKINDIKRIHNLEVVDILDIESVSHQAGPSDFVNLVKEADLIITDSFHAVAFSIIFNKHFIVLKRIRNDNQDMWSRITSLMDIFCLEKYCISNDDSSFEIDLSGKDISKELESAREKSISFLLEALQVSADS